MIFIKIINNEVQIGRVLYPIEYGADPTGAQDSSDAILRAVGDAFALESASVMLPGLKDLGGVVIDFQGANFTISKPITFPPSGAANLVVSLSSHSLSSVIKRVGLGRLFRFALSITTYKHA